MVSLLAGIAVRAVVVRQSQGGAQWLQDRTVPTR